MHRAISNSTVFHFADDTNLLFSHKDPSIIKKMMNNDLKSLFLGFVPIGYLSMLAKLNSLYFVHPKCPWMIG